MRSLLTRRVFRQLLSAEGLVFHCPAQRAHIPLQRRLHTFNLRPSTVTRHGHGYGYGYAAAQRRDFWNFFTRKAKKETRVSITPGKAAMDELVGRQNMNVRAPPAADLIKGWRTFFEHKNKIKEALNRHDAKCVLATLKHLTALPIEGQDLIVRLERNDLAVAKKALNILPKKGELDLHTEFARRLYVCDQDSIQDSSTPLSESRNISFLVHHLVKAGHSNEARDMLQTCAVSGENDVSDIAKLSLPPSEFARLWVHVLRGFGIENNEEELQRTLAMANECPKTLPRKIAATMLHFYANRDNIEATKEWYKKLVLCVESDTEISKLLSGSLLDKLLQFCIRTNQQEWCKAVFKDIISNEPQKEHWDVILRWAAGSMGKGVEDVERMMDVMVERGQTPDTYTINGLVKMAISLNDPYLAERYISAGQKRGIQPNAYTHILQMDYRAGANDLRGAQAAYEALASFEILNDAELPAVNKYMHALCNVKQPNVELLIALHTDIDERGQRLDPETVAALARVMLTSEHTETLVEILALNTLHYSTEERNLVRDAFIAYILNPWNNTANTWDAYNILRIIFSEMQVNVRVPLMNEFFRRRRSDMATHVFGHMRQHDFPKCRPVLDTYVQVFVGIAKRKDKTHLAMVHNMLRLDSSIEPNTRLYNALTLAYTECDNPQRAYQFWQDITMSHEGPSYNSLEIVFWTCANMAFGDDKAREIWRKLNRINVEVTREVFAAYMGSLARSAKWVEVKEHLANCEKDHGFKVDPLILGTIYNTIPTQDRRNMVANYSMEFYPEVWKELKTFGRYKTSKRPEWFFQMKVERKP